MMYTKYLCVFLAACLVSLVWKTVRSVSRAWGFAEREASVALLPQPIVTRPRLCHFCFVCLSVGVICLIILVAWFVLLAVFNNILKMDMERPYFVPFYVIGSLAGIGAPIMIAIAYLLPFFALREKGTRPPNQSS